MEKMTPGSLREAARDFSHGELAEGKRFSIHKPAEADEKLGAAYRDVLALKSDMDAMEEIPADLRPLYKQVMKAMDAIAKARQETTQLRGMAKKIR